jgi:hypothetical protein
MFNLGLFIKESELLARYDSPNESIDLLNHKEMPFSLELHFKNNNEMFLGNISDTENMFTFKDLWFNFCSNKKVEFKDFSCVSEKLLALQIKRMLLLSQKKYTFEEKNPDIYMAVPSYLGFSQRASLSRAFETAGMKNPVFLSRAETAVFDMISYNKNLLNKKFILLPFFDSCGMEISLVSFNSAGIPFLAGSSSTKSYSTRDIERHLAELLYKKTGDYKNKIPRKKFFAALAPALPQLLDQICKTGSVTKEINFEDLEENLTLRITANELSGRCSKIAKKLIEKTRSLIKESGFFTEQIDLLVPFGSSFELPCFKNSLNLFLGDIPAVIPDRDQKINPARGAASLGPIKKDSSNQPVNMDTILNIALDDGSSLPLVHSTCMGNTQVSGTFRCRAFPENSDSVEIIILEGNSPRSSENAYIGSFKMPVSSDSMELDISLLLKNSRIIAKAGSMFSVKSVEFSLVSPLTYPDYSLPLISRKNQISPLDCLSNKEKNLFRLILNGALESMCFNLSCRTMKLLKTDPPQFSVADSFLKNMPVCKKCNSPIELKYILESVKPGSESSNEVPVRNKAAGKKSKQRVKKKSSRVTFTCSSCSKKGWFSLDDRPEFQGIAMPCSNRENKLLGYISIIYKLSENNILTEIKENLINSVWGFLNFINLSLDDRVRISFPGIWKEKDVALAGIIEKKPLVFKNKIFVSPGITNPGFTNPDITNNFPEKTGSKIKNNKSNNYKSNNYKSNNYKMSSKDNPQDLSFEIFTIIPDNISAFIAGAFKEKINFYKVSAAAWNSESAKEFS